MSNKVHFVYGCPWADGSIQSSDTDQTCFWKQVTCKQCRALRVSGYGKARRATRWDWDARKDEVKPEHAWAYL